MSQYALHTIIIDHSKPLIAIVILASVFHFGLTYFPEDTESFDLYDALYIAGPIGTGLISFAVSKMYWSDIFGKAYLFLGIAFTMYGLGEIIWIYYETVLYEYPYPSIADVFYFMLFPFSSLHLIRNIRFFKLQHKTYLKVLFPLVTAIIVGFFAYLCLDYIEESQFDFFYSMIFMVGSAVVMSLSLLGAIIFRNSILGSIWTVLTIGIFVFTVADVWYYYAEVYESFDAAHPYNSIWMAGYMIISYALYRHYREFS